MAPRLNDPDDFENDADIIDDSDDELLIERDDELPQIRNESSWVVVDNDEVATMNNENDADSMTVMADTSQGSTNNPSDAPLLVTEIEQGNMKEDHLNISRDAAGAQDSNSVSHAEKAEVQIIGQIKDDSKDTTVTSKLSGQRLQIYLIAANVVVVLVIAASLFLVEFYYHRDTMTSSWQVAAQQVTQAKPENQAIFDHGALEQPTGAMPSIDRCCKMDQEDEESRAQSKDGHKFVVDNCMIRAKLSLELGECASEYMDRFTTAFQSMWNTFTWGQKSSPTQAEEHRGETQQTKSRTFEHLYDLLAHTVGWNMNTSSNSSFEYENVTTEDDIIRLFEDNVDWLTDIVYNATSQVIGSTKNITEKVWSTIVDATADVDADEEEVMEGYSDDSYTVVTQAAIDSVTHAWAAAKDALSLYSDGLYDELRYFSSSIATTLQDANVQGRYAGTTSGPAESSNYADKDVQEDALYKFFRRVLQDVSLDASSPQDEDVAILATEHVKQALNGISYKSIFNFLTSPGTDSSTKATQDNGKDLTMPSFT